MSIKVKPTPVFIVKTAKNCHFCQHLEKVDFFEFAEEFLTGKGFRFVHLIIDDYRFPGPGLHPVFNIAPHVPFYLVMFDNIYDNLYDEAKKIKLKLEDILPKVRFYNGHIGIDGTYVDDATYEKSDDIFRFAVDSYNQLIKLEVPENEKPTKAYRIPTKTKAFRG